MLPPITAHEDQIRFSGAWLAHWEFLFETALSGVDTTTRNGRQRFNRYSAAKHLVTQTIRTDANDGLRLAEAVLLQTVDGQAYESEVTSAWLSLKREADRLAVLAPPTPSERKGLPGGAVADLIEERRMAYCGGNADEAVLLGTREVEDRNRNRWLALQDRAA